MNLFLEKLRSGYKPNELYLTVLEVKDSDLYQIEEFMPYVPPNLLETFTFYYQVRLALKDSKIFDDYPKLFNKGSIIALIPVMKLFFKRNPTQFTTVREVISNRIEIALDTALHEETYEYRDSQDEYDYSMLEINRFEGIHDQMMEALDCVNHNRLDEVNSHIDSAISIEVNEVGRYHHPQWTRFEDLIKSFATFVKATNPKGKA